MPGVQVDVHSFELKTQTGVDTLAVHEALAQTRFTHFGHLVWHLPVNSDEEEHLAEVEEQCSVHGLGLIRMCNPQKLEETQILLDPVRKPTSAAIIDQFLLPRLSDEQQKKLAAFVHGKNL